MILLAETINWNSVLRGMITDNICSYALDVISCICVSIESWEKNVQNCTKSLNLAAIAERVESFWGWRGVLESRGVLVTGDPGSGGVACEGTRPRTLGTVRWGGKPWSGPEDKMGEQFNCLLKRGLLTLLTTRPRASPGSPSTCGTAYVHTSQHLRAVFGSFYLPICS